MTTDLLIDEVRATAVAVPTTRTCAWAKGLSYGHTRTIVEIRTRGGLVGFGEAPTDKAAPIIEHRFAALMKGRLAMAVTEARLACLGTHRDFGYLADSLGEMAYAAIDMALWDLRAKAAGVPLYVYLGGAVRARAPFVAYAYTVDLADGFSESEVPGIMAGIAKDSIAQTGAKMFEFKVGRHSVDCDIATVLEVRSAVGPDVDLAVDANLAMSMADARRFLYGVREARLANVEEPVSSLAGMSILRRDFDIPISTHCTDIEKLRGYPLIDDIVGDINADGGLGPVVKLAAVICSTGRRFWLRSNGETGIGFAVLCHLGMALPELERPSQNLLNWCEDDLILGPTWLTQDGGVRPPDSPGLGVELDRDALQHYSGLYRSRGAFSRYDAQ
jgi:glucarate dehydratase